MMGEGREMKGKEPLLDLSTDEAIAFIAIDGAPYNLIRTDCLSILQRQRLTRLGTELANTRTVKTEKNEQRYDNILLEMLCIIMPSAPRDLTQKLSIAKKIEAVNAYMVASGIVKKKKTQPEM